MDGATTRRGRPSMHRRFEDHHARRRLGGRAAPVRRRPRHPGRRPGVRLRRHAGRTSAPAARRGVWHELRVELTMGQWLDVVGAARGDRSPERARWVATLQVGPLHGGAAAAPRRRAGRAAATARRATRPSASRSARRSSCATTCSASSATPADRQAGGRRPARGQAHAAARRSATERADGRRAATCSAAAGPADLTDAEVAAHPRRSLDARGAVDAVEREIDRAGRRRPSRRSIAATSSRRPAMRLRRLCTLVGVATR